MEVKSKKIQKKYKLEESFLLSRIYDSFAPREQFNLEFL